MAYIVEAQSCGIARDGERIVEIEAAHIVTCPSGQKHWHSLTPPTAITHIAVQEALDGQAVGWMARAADAQHLRGAIS